MKLAQGDARARVAGNRGRRCSSVWQNAGRNSLWSGREDRSVMGPGNCGWLLVGIGEFCVVLRWWIL